MNKKVIYSIVALFSILAIVAGCFTSVNEYPKEILVNYGGNVPKGTFEASIGDDSIFTNGDIVSVTLYEKDGVMKDLCMLGSNNQYFCPFELGINISEASAEKQAKITSNLDIVKENGVEYLSKNLVLSLNGQTYEELRISPDLKGIKQINIRISGSGNGESKQEAIQDATKKSNELLNILLDKETKEGTELANPNQCKEVFTEYANQNPSLDLEVQLKKYCGSEEFKNTEILADSFGYKREVLLDYDGVELKMPYFPDLRNSVEWLNKNTDRGSKIMSWWDYGAMVKLFAEREPIAIVPSKEALKYVMSSDFTKAGIKLTNDETIRKIGTILTTDEPSEAVEVMKDLNVKYLFIPREMSGKFSVIYELIYGKIKFIDNEQNPEANTDELDNKSITYKALNNQPIEGFKLVYSDDSAVIYELTE